jgi:hypothetical protein
VKPVSVPLGTNVCFPAFSNTDCGVLLIFATLIGEAEYWVSLIPNAWDWKGCRFVQILNICRFTMKYLGDGAQVQTHKSFILYIYLICVT